MDVVLSIHSLRHLKLVIELHRDIKAQEAPSTSTLLHPISYLASLDLLLLLVRPGQALSRIPFSRPHTPLPNNRPDISSLLRHCLWRLGMAATA